ncbi:MAG TPA: LLM class flavin-dependent oxidoreductase [Acidimicrobiia bacterium]|nr:LLM class flavin-dependent oxidoreductase [Acidimicrobiia bacterium]
MRVGAHLPLMDFGGNPYSREHLVAYARAARDLGFDAVSANDHMVFSVPWLDGLAALGAVVEHTGTMNLVTTVALSVVRGPVPLAKSLAAIDRLSGGRVIAGVGPGSSADDYATVGIDFGERWPRFEASVLELRAQWTRLAPPPVQPDGPPVWIGSWGSAAGLRRVARLADGWLASAYNTTPALFADAWQQLQSLLGARADGFPNALATMWCYITDDDAEAERVLVERVVPTVHRPEAVLRERLPIGSPVRFAEKLRAFADAGVQQVFIWPVADEVEQLHRFATQVRPLLA